MPGSKYKDENLELQTLIARFISEYVKLLERYHFVEIYAEGDFRKDDM